MTGYDGGRPLDTRHVDLACRASTRCIPLERVDARQKSKNSGERRLLANRIDAKSNFRHLLLFALWHRLSTKQRSSLCSLLNRRSQTLSCYILFKDTHLSAMRHSSRTRSKISHKTRTRIPASALLRIRVLSRLGVLQAARRKCGRVRTERAHAAPGDMYDQSMAAPNGVENISRESARAGGDEGSALYQGCMERDDEDNGGWINGL